MIAKAIKGKGFRGALEYDLGKEQGRVIDTNMEGEGPRELAAEFGEIRKLRPKLGKAVLHVSLSAAPGEHLTDDQWREIGQRYLHGMGLDDNQYLITRHDDTDHEHVHLLVNRIRFDGKVTSDSHDYRRHEVLIREIERDYSLQPVRPSFEAQRHAATKGEIEQGLRTGIASTRQRLQQLCDAAVSSSRSYSGYAERLEAAGVDLMPVTQLDNIKLFGLSYRLDGVMMKGSDLGKGYSPAGLAKRGIGYEKDRDLAAVSRQREREERQGSRDANRGTAQGEDRERGAAGGDAGTDRARDGRIDGGDEIDLIWDRAHEPGTGREVRAADRGRDDEIGKDIDHSAPRSGPTERSEQPLDASDLLDSDGRSGAECAARERILDLAGAADVDKPGERNRAIAKARDRSVEAIERQIEGMGACQVDIQLHHVASGRLIDRRWSRDQLRQSVQWLKRMNALGHDVHVRPAGGHALVLVQRLDRNQLGELQRVGFAPAVALEVSANEYEAWIKLSDSSVNDPTRNEALAGFLRYLHASSSPEEINSYGRLAGMTNHAAALLHRGASKYVIARSATGEVAAKGPQLIGMIEQASAPAIALVEMTEPKPISGGAVEWPHNRDPDRSR